MVCDPVVAAEQAAGIARVDDRRVLNGIFWRLRTGAPWADIPERYGPHTTCVNRFNRWRRAGSGTVFWRRFQGHTTATSR
jgi:transposase